MKRHQIWAKQVAVNPGHDVEYVQSPRWLRYAAHSGAWIGAKRPKEEGVRHT